MSPSLPRLKCPLFLGSGSWFFFFPVRAFRFSRKNLSAGCSRNDDSCLPRPTASPVLLAWSGAQPCGAPRAGVVLVSWRHFRPAATPKPQRIVLAVLPFENLTGDPNKEYLADGLTEETISQLSRLNPG